MTKLNLNLSALSVNVGDAQSRTPITSAAVKRPLREIVAQLHEPARGAAWGAVLETIAGLHGTNVMANGAAWIVSDDDAAHEGQDGVSGGPFLDDVANGVRLVATIHLIGIPCPDQKGKDNKTNTQDVGSVITHSLLLSVLRHAGREAIWDEHKEATQLRQYATQGRYLPSCRSWVTMPHGGHDNTRVDLSILRSRGVGPDLAMSPPMLQLPRPERSP